jgi:FMN-dependent NADH-azoreductase
MKALVVTYLPNGVNSNTKKLVDHALGILKKKTVGIEHLDLTRDVPDLFTPERLAVYYSRNYGGQKATPDQAALMKNMDRMAGQVKNADLLLVAFPMHNFSQPAIVKGWFDAVMQKGVTWTITDKGYAGLMTGKKALVLSSSGGAYEGAGAAMEHSVSLTKVQFGFMGYEYDAVCAGGVNQFPDKVPETIAAANARITEILNKWIK